MTRDDWMTAVGIAEHEVPAAVILEGSWWLRERNRLRLPRLEDVRELAFPEMHLGRYRGRWLVYSCVYGAPRAVEPAHVFGMIGSPLLIQIGSCGALQPGIGTGDIVLPAVAAVGEGASQYYEPGVDASPADTDLLNAAARVFEDRGFRTHSGHHLTTSALFAQPPERVAAWRDAGYLAVDMETSAVFTVARHLGLRAVSLLFVWDELLAGRSFLDPYTPEETARQAAANLAIFDVALDLLEERP